MKDNRKSTNSSPLNKVKEVFEKVGLKPVPLPDAPGFAIGFEDDGPPVAGMALVYDDDRRFIFYLEFQKRAGTKNQSDVVEFITRANFGMTYGNFEMDYDSGLIRYKTSMDYTSGKLLPMHIRNVVLGGMEGVEVYADSLIAVMEGKKTPKQAILDAEGILDAD